MTTRLMLICFVLSFGAGSACGAETVVLRSRSGQFVVRGLPVKPSLNLRATDPEQTYVRLDPATMAVSCERVKQEFLATLKLEDWWKGIVQVDIQPVAEDNEPIQITSVRYRDGWGYHLECPETANRQRLVKALVHVLAAELANRKAGEREAELPPWLVDGLAANLMAEGGDLLTLDPSSRLVSRRRAREPLKQVREQLRKSAPLTFDELSWPPESPLEGAPSEQYQACAHLFVFELMRLPGGAAALGRMLARLGENLNWQTTFLQEFGGQFGRLVDVAKWWSLATVRLGSQEASGAWSVVETQRRLGEILITPAQKRVEADAIPENRMVSLQSVISEWPYSLQGPVLAEKVRLLQALRLRAAPETLEVLDGYALTISDYVTRRANPGREAAGHKLQTAPSIRLVVSDTVKRLNQLDTRRMSILLK